MILPAIGNKKIPYYMQIIICLANICEQMPNSQVLIELSMFIKCFLRLPFYRFLSSKLNERRILIWEKENGIKIFHSNKDLIARVGKSTTELVDMYKEPLNQVGG